LYILLVLCREIHKKKFNFKIKRKLPNTPRKTGKILQSPRTVWADYCLYSKSLQIDLLNSTLEVTVLRSNCPLFLACKRYSP